jgi:hypothetical protein
MEETRWGCSFPSFSSFYKIAVSCFSRGKFHFLKSSFPFRFHVRFPFPTYRQETGNEHCFRPSQILTFYVSKMTQKK